MTQTIWRNNLTNGSQEVLREIDSSLKSAGLNIAPFRIDRLSDPGILIFDKIKKEHHDFLKQISLNGLNRVLAIGVDHSSCRSQNLCELLESGASDVFYWDHSDNPALEVAAKFERWDAVDRVVYSPIVQNNLVGNSPCWISVLRQIVEISCFTNAPVVISGETGTGKECTARLIHQLDRRPAKGDFVILDCTTIIPEISGSELFGHERGAFTGAVMSRDGAFSLADGGTLFLDEVGELPLDLQAKLLRVIQEHTFKPLGGDRWKSTSFRLICATNVDLSRAIFSGRFRRDLYYRINGCAIRLPPLKERADDILLLTEHFMRELDPETYPHGLDDSVRDIIMQREYAGNVRDLKRLVSLIIYKHVGPGPITIGDIPGEFRPYSETAHDWSEDGFERAVRKAISMGRGLKEISRQAGDVAVRIALSRENGNLRRAANRLGVTERTLQNRRADWLRRDKSRLR